MYFCAEERVCLELPFVHTRTETNVNLAEGSFQRYQIKTRTVLVLSLSGQVTKSLVCCLLLTGTLYSETVSNVFNTEGT